MHDDNLQDLDKLSDALFTSDPENADSGVHILLPDGYQHALGSRTRIVDDIVTADRSLSYLPLAQSRCYQLLTNPHRDYLDTVITSGPS